MEPARSTGNFNRRITVADSNNIITVLDVNAANAKYQIFDQDYLVEFQAVLEDLKITVGLLSLLEAPWPDTNALMGESATMAEIAKIRTQGQKISLGLYVASGNGPWQYESEVVLQNQGGSETHVPILVPFLSSNETLLIAGNFKLGVKIEPKWNQPLKINDYLVIKGTWRQIVSFSKKKDDDVEFLAARIETLELALYGRLTDIPANSLLGRNTNTGVAEIIPQSKFATPAQITSAITAVVGSSQRALDTLSELGAALGNDADFATTVINLLATKVNKDSNETISGNKKFTGFTDLGNAGTKYLILSFTSPTASNNTEILQGQLPAMEKIIILTGWLKCVDTDSYPPSFFSEFKQYTNWWSIYSWANNLYINLHPSALIALGNQPGRIIVTYTN